MYAIIDIETTGGSPKFEKITEIAIYIYDGNKIIDEFVSLVNPEKFIPAHITALTGISNEMVTDAPKFYEIAEKVIKLTENRVFVAHNVSFDYNFIKQEFKSLGYHYQREQLCTVRLSRKLIPGLRSYSLGNLCAEFGIENSDRHRAAGDALATIKLFEMLMDINSASGLALFEGIEARMKNLNPALDIVQIKNLPEETGVYYFIGVKGDILYIGKSKNIKSRILSHLNNTATRRAIELVQSTISINYVLTGSELIALLKESSEIKKFKPYYNRAQRRTLFQYGLYYFTDDIGYLNFEIRKNLEDENIPLYTFSSKKEALKYVNEYLDQFKLCQKYCGIHKGRGACFHYELMECKGACIGLESPETYNLRAVKLLKMLTFEHRNIILIDTGRNSDEYSVVKIENGKYVGFGYFESSESISTPEQVDDYIVKYSDTRDIQSILRNYLRKQKVLKKIEF